MSRHNLLIIFCGLAPLLVINYAYWVNIHAPDTLAAVYQCNPYFEGCVSVSRAVRSGPGLWLFKAIMLPCAIGLIFSWKQISRWLRYLDPHAKSIRIWTLRLGIAGVIALAFYVVFLGTEGEIYRWLRRYGVVFFFGFTALSQLLVARQVWAGFETVSQSLSALFLVVVGMQWLTGVGSVLKRLVFDDPGLINQLENITEWLMVALMSLGLVLVGLLMKNHPSKP